MKEIRTSLKMSQANADTVTLTRAEYETLIAAKSLRATGRGGRLRQLILI